MGLSLRGPIVLLRWSELAGGAGKQRFREHERQLGVHNPTVSAADEVDRPPAPSRSMNRAMSAEGEDYCDTRTHDIMQAWAGAWEHTPSCRNQYAQVSVAKWNHMRLLAVVA